MAEHGRISVIINGKKVQTVNRVYVGQELFDHHNFEVSVPLRTLVKVHDDEDPFPALKDTIGKDIEIKFGIASSDDEEGQNESSTFVGIVKDISVYGNAWEHAHVSIKGNSPTILIDGIGSTRAFAEKGIADIYDECSSDHLSSKINVSDNLTYTDKLPFTVQWQESEFDFIGRLCFQNGEWFYYNGEALCLGLDNSGDAVTLRKNRVRSLRFDYSVVPGISGISFRDYNKNELKQLTPEDVSGDDDMVSFAISESKDLYSGEGAIFSQAPSFASGDKLQYEEEQMKHHLKVHKQFKTAGVLTLSGESDNASIKLGGTIRLDGFNHSGDFTVISLSHTCIDAKSYSNQFIAIPKGSSYPKKLKFKDVKIHPCSAVVTDNKDPKKWGRIKVKFDWFQGIESPWIRIINQHAGDKRGTYFIPEIGDEVMVGFEHGDPRYPYVLGAVYNGKNFNEAAYDGDNNLKVIRTRTGNEILFDDNGRIRISNNHNVLELNTSEDGRITIETDGDIEFTAGKNMSINVGENFALNVGQESAINIGKDSKTAVGGNTEISCEKNIELNASSNIKMEASKDIETSSMNTKIDAKTNAEISATNAKVQAKASAELSASATTTVKGGMVKIN